LPPGAVVADVMISAPKCCVSTATVGDVRQLFLNSHVHAALLVDIGVLLAVVERIDLVRAGDEGGAALGLLCLKRSGTGFCSDRDVNARRSDWRTAR
jgi:hypothetical protein